MATDLDRIVKMASMCTIIDALRAGTSKYCSLWVPKPRFDIPFLHTVDVGSAWLHGGAADAWSLLSPLFTVIDSAGRCPIRL